MSDLPYAGLGPDLVLDAVEAAGLECDGRLLTLNSYENRVYRVGLTDAGSVIVKFYRPGRWSDEAIIEEHRFTFELADAELDVCAPMRREGISLHRHLGFRYALFPSLGGRAPEPGDRDSLSLLGRTLARLHNVGAIARFEHRPRLDIDRYGREPVAYLLEHDWLPAHLITAFETLSGHVLTAIEQGWQRAGPVATLRVHGDCHLGNLLERDRRIVLVDLDDAVTAPAVQDLWMLLSGDEEEQRRQLGWLLEGYGLFRDFDPCELALIEPLRALRLLHYHGWIARRWHDPAFPAAFPWFSEHGHWERLIGQLHEQLAALQEPALLP